MASPHCLANRQQPCGLTPILLMFKQIGADIVDGTFVPSDQERVHTRGRKTHDAATIAIKAFDGSSVRGTHFASLPELSSRRVSSFARSHSSQPRSATGVDGGMGIHSTPIRLLRGSHREVGIRRVDSLVASCHGLHLLVRPLCECGVTQNELLGE